MRDTDLIGRTAARFLLDAVTNPRQPASASTLPTWFESRASCGKPKQKK
jgi:DNA-binding LacI/PurR family transcriptional regulator